MRNRVAAALLALTAGVGAGACRRADTAAAARLPAGDGVWFSDGVQEGAGDTELSVTRGGFGAVFLPVTHLVADGEGWRPLPIAPPSKPFVRVPVVLVISADEPAAAALAAPGRSVRLEDAVWLAAKAALRDGPQFGTVRGIHLDIPFAAAGAEAYGSLLRSVRAKLPAGVLLTQTLRFAPDEASHERVKKAGMGSDGWVALVFGGGGSADPAATDRLDRPWLAAYAPAAVGRLVAGESENTLPESVLAALTDDSRVEFAHDLSLREESASGFLLTPHQPVSIGGRSLRAGDQVQFRQPSLSDMVFHFGADLAGKRLVRGRVVELSGRSEAERIFTLGALDDILLGRPLNADLRITVETSKKAILLGAENPTPHASVVSRTSNWVEVDIPGASVSDVRAGGFDRYEVYGSEGSAVTLGRANRLRFFETLVSPFEKIEPARIVLRKEPPRDCCPHRIHILSSAGAEIVREGDASPQ